ncbi:MAG TPA: PTS sugar transporter subunit IIA [Planctomycetota bacterium]|nr:PTS sugar transporter subunit IIA [Planctomycetota bacterium]
MSLGRLFREELVKLELESGPEPLPEGVEPTPAALEKARWRFKERVCGELVALFAASGEVRNEHKFLVDLINREKKASTAIGEGLAVPHVRSLQPRSTVVIFARSTAGVEYYSPDRQPVHLFFGITAPSYDDADYLKIYKWLATSFTREDWLRPALMSAEEPGEVVRILKSLPG